MLLLALELIFNQWRTTKGHREMGQLKDAISAKDAADLLGVTPGRIRQFALEGKLKGSKFAGLWVFSRADVEEFSKQKRPKAGRPKHETK
jgi:excisionase family DNA binding protein